MKRIIYLVGILIIFTSCHKNVKKKYYETGELKSELYYKDHKLIKELHYYKNTVIQYQIILNEEGGLYKITNYHNNGKFATRYYFKNNLQHCINMLFDDKGEYLETNLYINGIQKINEMCVKLEPGDNFFAGFIENHNLTYKIQQKLTNRIFYKTDALNMIKKHSGNLLYSLNSAN